MEYLKELPDFKEIAKLISERTNNSKYGQVELIEGPDYHLILNHISSVPEIWLVYETGGDGGDHLTDMKWALNLFEHLVYSGEFDWDMDDISWQINSGFTFHGFPDNFPKVPDKAFMELIYEKNKIPSEFEERDWSFISLILTDEAS